LDFNRGQKPIAPVEWLQPEILNALPGKNTQAGQGTLQLGLHRPRDSMRPVNQTHRFAYLIRPAHSKLVNIRVK
jgi:hypothetical protein